MPATSTLPIRTAPTSAAGLAQNAAPLKAGQSVDALAAGTIAEPKMDGWRLLVHVAEDGTHLYARSAKEYTGSLPKIEAELAKHLPPGTWLDCEAVAFTVSDGIVTHEWGVVQSVLGSGTAKAAGAQDKITLVAFDLISHGGVDARPLPFAQRRELLERIFDGKPFSRVMLCPQMQTSSASLDAALAHGFEGIMIKTLSAPYASGKRGKGQTKVKPQATLDGVIIGYKDGANGFTGLVGALVIGQHNADGELVEVLRCSGMDMATRQKISADRDAYLGKVIEVKHMGQMPSGGYRHPQFNRFRPDKPATDCEIGA